MTSTQSTAGTKTTPLGVTVSIGIVGGMILGLLSLTFDGLNQPSGEKIWIFFWHVALFTITLVLFWHVLKILLPNGGKVLGFTFGLVVIALMNKGVAGEDWLATVVAVVLVIAVLVDGAIAVRKRARRDI